MVEGKDKNPESVLAEHVEEEAHISASEDEDGAPSGAEDHPTASADTPGAGSSSTSSSKKRKKKKSKAAKLLNSLKPGQKDVPQSIVEQVMARIRAQNGEDTPGTDEETVRQALEQLKIMDVVQGKAGIAGRGKKDLGEHRVCLLYAYNVLQNRRLTPRWICYFYLFYIH